MYADVIVDISIENLDKPYQYLIPFELVDVVKPGTPVVIPFGNGNRLINGYVIGITEKCSFDPAKIKPIASLTKKTNSIDQRMIDLAWWMKERFGSTMNEALKCVLPVKKQIRSVVTKTIIPIVSNDRLKKLLMIADEKRHVAKARFYRELIEAGELDRELAVKKLGISAAVIAKAVEDRIVRVDEQNSYRMPRIAKPEFAKTYELNDKQRYISDSIKNDIEKGIRKDYLIHGITGSGKTEVYMDIIDSVIAKGKQVIMLIPEIALTYQTVKRFYLRFGDRISIMNSKLSYGERYDQYQRAKNGETDIVIGPRSALFTPFSKLGLIIIDEEHEPSYISETSPRYSAREVALYLASNEGASVIFGSATPSLEVYSMAKTGRVELFELNERAGNAKVPDVYIADMREELKAGNRTPFSRELMDKLSRCLKNREQAMLFLNRRGYSGFTSCRSCGNVIKCPHCDVSMTLHRNGNMVCHYCGYSAPVVKNCPKCGSPYIGSFGIGTQKIEEQLKLYFPNARILRMDADTTKQKNGYEEILSRFSNEEADILVGTQMIVKGHDFPKVTLVGVLLADLSLYSPDFRAAERTFQLINQASGRAGRGELKGNVVIQTYNPENYSISFAAASDYKSFFEEEYAFRRLLGYPPAASLLSVLSIAADEETAKRGAETVRKAVPMDFKVIGPAPAPLAKANDMYRFVLYVKSDDVKLLVRLKDRIEDVMSEFSDFTIQFIFN